MTDAIRYITGSGGGKGGGSSGAIEDPNTLQSDSILRVMEVLSEGPIVGLVNGAKSVFFNETPLQNADGSYNFIGTNIWNEPGLGVSYDIRTGTTDQDYMPGLPDVEDTVGVGVQVFQASPIVRTIEDYNTDAVQIVIQVPQLTYQDPSTGNLHGNSVSLNISIQGSGGSYVTAINDIIAGKTTSAYQRAYRVNLASYGSPPWNVKVTRTSPDDATVYTNSQLIWSSYTTIIDHKLTYPDTAYVGLTVDSQLFGQSVPNRAYDIKGLIIKVPSNYDPTTRVYTGVWDGTFQSAWTDNPAWIFYDLLTNNRYGLGQYVNASEVDIYGLYTIAQYCDELVPDGQGGMEPRFTFNYVIDTQQKALKVLQSVSSVFRGMVYWGATGTSGIIAAVADMPKDAVKQFSNANVWGGLFTYSGVALEACHSAVWVTWNNPELFYKNDIEVYEDQSLIEKYGYRKIDVVAYGCTSRGQARRFGKWMLETEQNESETVVFSVALADADIRPGDIVNIFDSDYAEVRLGGRVVSATLNSITMDNSVTLDSGTTSEITVTMPDGTLETKNITNTTPGTYTTVNLDSDLTVIPNQYAMFGITSSEVSPRQFRVIGVKEKNPNEFEVTAMVYDSTKFARVEENINTPPLNFTRFATGVLGGPSNITFKQYLSVQGVTSISNIDISWTASTDPRVIQYSLEVLYPGNSSWSLLSMGNGLNFTLKNAIDGTYSFRVRGFDALGNTSAYANLISQTVNINSIPPDDVASFQIANLGDTSILSWSPVSNINLSHYEIRYSQVTTGALWDSATAIIEQQSNKSTSVSVPTRSGTYFIKAVTLPTTFYPFGIYSVNATGIITNLASLSDYTFVIETTQDSAFNGVKSNLTLSAGELSLYSPDGISVVPTGFYAFDSVIDLGVVTSFRLTAKLTVSGDIITNDVDHWTDVDLIVDVDGNSDGQWKLTIQVSITQDDPVGYFLSEDGTLMYSEEGELVGTEEATAVWADWLDLTTGNSTGRAMIFKAVFESFADSITPLLSALSVDVDVPNVTEQANDIAVPNTGQVVTYPNAFYTTSSPAIAIAAQNMQTGDYYTITSKTNAGFTIKFFDSTGTGVARTFDYIAKGFGQI